MAGLGFMHGRDRMMQMDLSRRKAAGELAALIGPPMVAIDRPNAIRRRREIAERIVSELRPEEQRLLDAYTAGVNAAIAGFRNRSPVEYRLLNTRPAEWRARRLDPGRAGALRLASEQQRQEGAASRRASRDGRG